MCEQKSVVPLEADAHNRHRLTSTQIPLAKTSHTDQSKSRSNEVHSICNETIARAPVARGRQGEETRLITPCPMAIMRITLNYSYVYLETYHTENTS